jgi:hypothetical protein
MPCPYGCRAGPQQHQVNSIKVLRGRTFAEQRIEDGLWQPP